MLDAFLIKNNNNKKTATFNIIFNSTGNVVSKRTWRINDDDGSGINGSGRSEQQHNIIMDDDDGEKNNVLYIKRAKIIIIIQKQKKLKGIN